MAELDVKKLRGLLESLGIGKRGLDTPAKRTYLEGVMDTANIGYEKTGGVLNTSGVMDTGQNAYSEAVSQKLAEQDAYESSLGVRGMSVPAERDFIQKVMSGVIQLSPEVIEKFRYIFRKSGMGARGTNTPESAFMQKIEALQGMKNQGGFSNFDQKQAMMKILGIDPTAGEYTFDVDGQTEGYTFDSYPTKESIERMRAIQGITASGLNPAMETTAGGDTEQQFLRKVMADKDRIFSTKMQGLTPQQIQQVNAVMQRLSPQQQQLFKEQVVTGNVPLDGYAIQDEGLPIQNLGFGY